MTVPKDKTVISAVQKKRIVTCLNCSKPFDAKNNKPGSQVTCPACLSVVEIPAGQQKRPPLKNAAANTSMASTIPPKPKAAHSGIDTAVLPGKGREAKSSPPKKEEACPRRQLGTYEIRSFLGKGGMGCVYKAFDTALHRPVAIKELAPQLAQQKDLVERFLREARLVAQLNHVNICDIYYLGMDKEKKAPFYAMEFVDGENVDEVLQRKGPLPLKEALSIVTQTAIALQAAHAKGMIHRDIKPANIMLTKNGVAKVTDFGLAKLLEGGQQLTQSNVIMGTPHYMSPEAARGEECDYRSDVYSLGATFFHILTGQLPFDGPTAMSVLHKHLNENVPNVSSIRTGVPAEIASLIEKMMEKDAAKRHDNYKELIEELEKHAGKKYKVKSGGKVQGPKLKIDTELLSSLGITQADLETAGKKAVSVAKTLAPRISIKRRWKIKVLATLFILLFSKLAIFRVPGMVFVPAGNYLVGEPDNLRKVHLSAFYIDQYEVTNAKYRQALGQSAPDSSTAYLPKVLASEAELGLYLEATGLELPTEEQWQAAARGQTGQAYPWGNPTDDDDFDGTVNTSVTGLNKPAEVGYYSFDYSPAGCYDMAGNVREVVIGDMDGKNRKNKYINNIMGASFNSSLDNDSCGFTPGRYRPRAYFSSGDIGFRCVKNVGFFTTVYDWVKRIGVLLVIVLLCLFL